MSYNGIKKQHFGILSHRTRQAKSLDKRYGNIAVKYFSLDRIYVYIQLQKWTKCNLKYIRILYYYCMFSIGVCLHFETNRLQPKSPYLFYPHITPKNCVRNTNNSRKQFGILFGAIPQNHYKSIQYKFSDNSNLFPNHKNTTQKSSKILEK